ncbi:hypothetical protein BS78_K282800 [Paspalum vaginatum]|uniref:Uncharacterized protein n=1 Tax=Paspalum vaginatum TaxID=158149 RepID=A0A9W8CEW5_9POAL|nr:hypothetical protein BS78_K282800 [Paspalum vaginatum]
MKALKRLFCKAAKKVINDSLYNARITVVCHYYKLVKGEKMTKKKRANRIYLKEEEYLEVLGSRPGNGTPETEVDPNEYLRNSDRGFGIGHNSNNPQP